MKKQTKQPLISVILPVYNSESYVAEAIESILTQTYRNFELIIVDDASTDRSWKVIAQYKKLYPNKITAVRLQKNRNRGGDEAGNLAFQKTKGEFIARMDADDIAHPERLEKQVSYMVKHPECGVLGTSATVINGEGNEIGVKKVYTTHQQILANYFTYHPMINPTIMVRRSAIMDKNSLYIIKFPKNNDYYTFFTLITNGVAFANLSEKLLKYRMHGNNDSLSGVKKIFYNTLKIRWTVLRESTYRPSLKAWIACLSQVTLISLLPEQLLFQLYLVFRGIYQPKEMLRKLLRLSNLSYSLES